MIEAYSVEQIRAVEAIALQREGDGVLMRRASYAVALEAAERVPGRTRAAGPCCSSAPGTTAVMPSTPGYSCAAAG